MGSEMCIRDRAIGERVGHEAVDITYHYAHLFPTVQTDMTAQLETEREALVNVRKRIEMIKTDGVM